MAVAAVQENLSQIAIGSSKGLSLYLTSVLKNIFEQYGLSYRLPTHKPVATLPQQPVSERRSTFDMTFVPFGT